jgi:NMD protein affecting ribosome stability and mRNA decay
MITREKAEQCSHCGTEMPGIWMERSEPLCSDCIVKANGGVPHAIAKQLVEALEMVRQDINWMLNERKFLNPDTFEYVDVALAAHEALVTQPEEDNSNDPTTP